MNTHKKRCYNTIKPNKGLLLQCSMQRDNSFLKVLEHHDCMTWAYTWFWQPGDYVVLPSSGQTKQTASETPLMPLNSLHQNDR